MPSKGATYDVAGNLIIKGIKNPGNLKVKKSEEKDRIYLKGDLVFDRTLYDIKFRSKKFFESLGDKLIYDDVKLSVEINFPKDLLKN